MSPAGAPSRLAAIDADLAALGGPSRFHTVSRIVPGSYDIQFVVAPWNSCVLAGASLHRNEVWKVTQWTVFGSQSGDCSHVAGYVPAARRAWVWQPASGSDMKRE